MANKKEIEKFINEKMKDKTVTLKAEEIRKQIERSTIKALEKNEALLLSGGIATISVIKKVSLDIMNAIARALLDKPVDEIIHSKEFLEKFASDISLNEVIKNGDVDENLKNLLKELQKHGVHIEVKTINLD